MLATSHGQKNEMEALFGYILYFITQHFGKSIDNSNGLHYFHITTEEAQPKKGYVFAIDVSKMESIAIENYSMRILFESQDGKRSNTFSM